MKKLLTSRTIAVPLRFSHFTATQLLVVGAVGVLLYVAHAAFIPIALALLFALVLSGPVEALYKLKVPRGVGASVMLVMVLCVGVGIGDAMWTPCQN